VTTAAAMFSLQKLLGKEDPFFTLLEASAKESQNSVQALKRILQNPSMTPTLDEFVTSRRHEKEIHTEIRALLVNTFVTALEREDIESLSHALYKIPKIIEKFAERYILCAPRLREVNFDRHLTMMDEVTQTLFQMVQALRKKSDLDGMKDFNNTLQRIEGDADKLMLEVLRDLYGGKYDPITAVVLKDLYELLEKVFDRCRDAGNVVFHIVLKHS
jgi:uncharacterized protein Yka (UPF0111/DUF47 family)